MELFIAPALFGLCACIWLRVQQQTEHFWLNRYPRLLWLPTYFCWFLMWAIGSAILITFGPLIMGLFLVYLILKLIPPRTP